MREWNTFHEKVIMAKLRPALEKGDFTLTFSKGVSWHRVSVKLEKGGKWYYPHTDRQEETATGSIIVDYTIEEIIEQIEQCMERLNADLVLL